MTPQEIEQFRSSVVREGRGPTARIHVPQEALEELYCRRLLSALEIGRLLGVSKKTIRLRLIEYGIARRSLKEAFAVSTTHAAGVRLGGEHHPSWKGGRKYNQGYVMVHLPAHPDAAKYLGYVFEHRLVMERILGRSLLAGEEVHHKNEVRDDNRPENLELLSKNEHMHHHASKRHASGDPSFGFKKRNDP